MKLTIVHLIDLHSTGISDGAAVLYLSANTWAMERGNRVLSCAALATMPGAPRDAKKLGRLILECMSAGLLAEAPGGYEVLERLSAAAKRMRRHRENTGVTRYGPVLEQERNGADEQTANGSGAPSPRTPQTLPEGSVSSGSESGSLLSSDPRPVRRRARAAAGVPWPDDFDTAIAPRVHAWAKGEGYPQWWVDERLADMKLRCGAKHVTYANWYLGTIGWLRRDDKEYGNGPDALLAKRARNGKPPGLIAHERHRAEEEREPAPYNHQWLDR